MNGDKLADALRDYIQNLRSWASRLKDEGNDAEYTAVSGIAKYLSGMIEYQSFLAAGSAQGVGDGFVRVPIKLTGEMQEAFLQQQSRWSPVVHVSDEAVVPIWEAMLDAATKRDAP